MIAAWCTCIDCGVAYGLQPRQCHAGLRAQTKRCAACRTARRRQLGALRARNYRQRLRHAKSAPMHATAVPADACGEQGGFLRLAS